MQLLMMGIDLSVAAILLLGTLPVAWRVGALAFLKLRDRIRGRDFPLQ